MDIEAVIVGGFLIGTVLFFGAFCYGNYIGGHDLASSICEHNGMMLADYSETNGTIRCIRAYDVVEMNDINRKICLQSEGHLLSQQELESLYDTGKSTPISSDCR
jgi:hypothetical protein